MTWNLRHASHLGYMRPDAPLLLHTAGSADPIANVEAAAELGLAGVQDVWAGARPLEEQRQIGEALVRLGLEGGCVSFTARERLRNPLWGEPGDEVPGTSLRELTAAIETAKRVNSRHIVVIGGARAGRPLAYQHALLVDRLKGVADRVERDGMVICLEAINRKAVPDLLLHHVADAYALVRAVGHPAVKLIFDTAHVQAMDGDILANLEAVWDEIALIQIVDNPGRTEPGSGELNFASILRAVAAKGFSGLVEWEHDWSRPGPECEHRGIEAMRRLDADLTTRRQVPAASS